MQQGYFKLYRQIFENPLLNQKPFCRGYAWIYLIGLANHSKGFIKAKNNQLIPVERGECGYSMVALAEIFGWDRRTVKRFILSLENEKMVQQKIVENHSIIKILNYDNYQSSTTNGTTNGTQTINDKNDNIIPLEKLKKYDPYTHPVKEYYINEYKRIIGTKPYLTNIQCNKLFELANEDTDIEQVITTTLYKLKNIEFKDINFNPSSSWLLKDDNFARVYMGEFDSQLKIEKKPYNPCL